MMRLAAMAKKPSPNAYQIKQAIHELTMGYVSKFDEQPDGSADMIIRVSARRVAAGDAWEWVAEHGWKKLIFKGK